MEEHALNRGVRLGSFALICALCASCGAGSSSPANVVAPPPEGTQMTLTSSAATDAPGDLVRFTITASNTQQLLQTVAIDFEGDGVWDAQQDFSTYHFSTSFGHVYLKTGVYTVHAIVSDLDGGLTVKTLTQTIAGQPLTTVWWTMVAQANPSTGVCYATGPPYTFDTQAMVGQLSEPMGSPSSGTVVSINQSFRQDATIPGTTSPYACSFFVKISASTLNGVQELASGGCQTPVGAEGRLNCNVSISGVVP